MENVEKCIEEFRKILEAKKNENYAIKNTDLAKLPESSKEVYIKILCTIVQYKNETTPMQLLLLRRIINGMNGSNQSLADYMGKALRFSNKDIEEFLLVMKEDKTKYYFTLDGLLLIKLGQASKDTYEYFSELIELFGINKDDLKFISLVAKSVLQQQSSFYDEAKKNRTERVTNLDFSPYISNYYIGEISDGDKIIHVSAPERKDANSVKLRTNYSSDTVIIEKSNCELLETCAFVGCKEVVLQDCKFMGDKFSLFFIGCQKVSIKNCIFVDFKVPVLLEQRNNEFYITDCTFSNCYAIENMNTCNWRSVGGVIRTEYSAGNAKNIISGTEFVSCGVRNETYTYSSAIISNCDCDVNTCKFKNCRGYYYGNCVEPDNGTMFLSGTEGKDNKIINSAKFC